MASTSTLLFAFTSQETGALSRVLHALSRNHKWTRMTVLDPRMIAWLSLFREPASLSAPGGGASSELPLRRRSRSLPPPPPPPPPRSSTAPSSRRCRPTAAPRNRGAPSPLLRFLLGARTRRRNLLRSLFLRRRPPSVSVRRARTWSAARGAAASASGGAPTASATSIGAKRTSASTRGYVTDPWCACAALGVRAAARAVPRREGPRARRVEALTPAAYVMPKRLWSAVSVGPPGNGAPGGIVVERAATLRRRRARCAVL